MSKAKSSRKCRSSFLLFVASIEPGEIHEIIFLQEAPKYETRNAGLLFEFGNLAKPFVICDQSVVLSHSLREADSFMPAALSDSFYVHFIECFATWPLQVMPDGPKGAAYLLCENFQVIMRYNSRVLYGFAVCELARLIQERASMPYPTPPLCSSLWLPSKGPTLTIRHGHIWRPFHQYLELSTSDFASTLFTFRCNLRLFELLSMEHKLESFLVIGILMECW